jgi:hypothetical protein
MRLYLRDAEGHLVAFRDASEKEWSDPHGALFTEKDQRDMTALAEGKIDDITFGCQGMRLVVRF